MFHCVKAGQPQLDLLVSNIIVENEFMDQFSNDQKEKKTIAVLITSESCILHFRLVTSLFPLATDQCCDSVSLCHYDLFPVNSLESITSMETLKSDWGSHIDIQYSFTTKWSNQVWIFCEMENLFFFAFPLKGIGGL